VELLNSGAPPILLDTLRSYVLNGVKGVFGTLYEFNLHYGRNRSAVSDFAVSLLSPSKNGRIDEYIIQIAFLLRLQIKYMMHTILE
jgi:hypothetical protein